MLPGEMKELRSEGLQSYAIRTKAQIWVEILQGWVAAVEFWSSMGTMGYGKSIGCWMMLVSHGMFWWISGMICFFSMSLRFFDRSNDRIGEDADPHASQDRFDLWLATVPEKEEVIDDEEEEAVGQKDWIYIPASNASEWLQAWPWRSQNHNLVLSVSFSMSRWCWSVVMFIMFISKWFAVGWQGTFPNG